MEKYIITESNDPFTELNTPKVTELCGIAINNFEVAHKLLGQPIPVESRIRPTDRIRIEMRVIRPELMGTGITTYVGSIELIRIPSNRNMTHMYAAGGGYDMGKLMKELGERPGIIADEMKLFDWFQCSSCRKYLDKNDLYYVKHIHVDPAYQRQGVGRYMMEKLPYWVRRITREHNPVFAAVPYCYWLDYTAEEKRKEALGVGHFLIKCGWKLAKKNSSAMYYVQSTK
ncbi:MAG: GNAT family N-acetyltransferase [Bacteroidaceae bacterium]|nr:GNAT family N-acetyltransferase [Bacteroidaceae bacterium]